MIACKAFTYQVLRSTIYDLCSISSFLAFGRIDFFFMPSNKSSLASEQNLKSVWYFHNGIKNNMKLIL